MTTTDFINSVPLILGVSVAGERLVSLVKTVIPWLAGSTQPVPPADSTMDNIRKVILMILAFLSCLATALLIKPDSIPPVLLALLASGGSAFWTSILGYTKAVSDIKSQQKAQEKVKTALAMANFESTKKENRIKLALGRISNLTAPIFYSAHNLNFIKI